MQKVTRSPCRTFLHVGIGVVLVAAAVLPYGSVFAHDPSALTQQTLLAEADAHVQDGAFSATNFGTDLTLFVKQDDVGFNRDAFLRFDVSGLLEPVVDAQLRLHPVSVDIPGIWNALEFVADDTWDETVVTWDTKPASFDRQGRWTPAVGTPVDVDVTAKVREALAGDGKVSFLVLSEYDIDSLGTVEYGSREGASVPELIVTTSSATDESDLQVTLTAPATAPTGDQINYTATVTNAGPFDTDGAKVAITAPADVSLAGVTPSQGGCSTNGSVVTCDLGNLANSAQATVLVEAVVLTSAAGSVQASATAWSVHQDSTPVNDTAIATTTISGSAFQAVEVFPGFWQPTSMTFAPDGRIFVTEKNGTLRVIKDGVLLPTPFLTVTVSASGERGLLGVAFPPNFEINGHVYVYYTQGATQLNTVSRFTVDQSGVGDTADPNSELVILQSSVTFSANHNGGAMHFGPDGYLYVAMGELGKASNAQNLGVAPGSMLRIDPENYPSITPSDGLNLNGNIWAAGLRNPFTFAIDDQTGRLYINDVGLNDWEEINEGTIGAAGLNYGWAICEGYCNAGFTNPTYAYPHPVGQAITGGVFYRGNELPSAYDGDYLFGDYLRPWINRLTEDGRVYEFISGVIAPLDIDVGPDGRLYFISWDSESIYEIVYTGTGNRLPTAVASAVPTFGLLSPNLSVTFDATGSSDPDLDTLSYTWDFGDGSPSSNLANVVHDYTSNGAYAATLTVDDGNGGIATDTATITVGSTPPTATIADPLLGANYSAGDTITYSGSGADAEDGALSASAMSWVIQFGHDDGVAHFHPAEGPLDGVTGGNFTIPTLGETSPNVWYRISLTVTDSSGLTDTTFVDLSPNTVNVTVDTSPTGLEVLLDGAPKTAPHVFTGVVGLERSIGTTSPQNLGGPTYLFDLWSDAGAITHDIFTPGVDTTFTASFTESPVPQDIAINVAEDSFVDVTLIASDGDTCELIFSIMSGTANGTLGILVDQACIAGIPNTDTATITYTPNANFNGADTFTYLANDGIQDSGIATVTVTVDPVNDVPVATGEGYALNQPDALIVAAPGVLANDTDIDAEPLSATVATGVTNGTLALNADGSFTYTPDPAFFGSDNFTYTADDAVSSSAPVTVTLDVNGRPLAGDDVYEVDEDNVRNVTVPGVLNDDSDPELSPLTAVLSTDVSDGTLTLNPDGSFTYTPNADFNGQDSFTYTANDGAADSLPATVTVNVKPDVDFSLIPSLTVAVLDATTDTTFTVDIVVGADPLQPVDSVQAFVLFDPLLLQGVSIAQGPIFSTDWNDVLSTNIDNIGGVITFVGGKGISGNDATAPFVLATITFDTAGATPSTDLTFGSSTPTSTKAISAALNVTGDFGTASLTITRPPVANDQGENTNEDTPLAFTLGASDPDGDPLTYDFLTSPTDGVLTGSGPNVTYTPNADFNGSDSFTYRVNDGTVDSQDATVTITVNAVNDAPVAFDDAYATNEDTVLNVTLPGVLANDTDTESDPLTSAFVVASGPANGTLTLNADGSFIYTPDADFNGSDSFRYTANDGLLGSNEATVTITVNAVNVAQPGVLTNDTDTESDPLTSALVVASGPANGTLTLNADGSFTYTPNAEFNGSDSFRYTANDGLLDSNEATVTITVNAVNDAPVAFDEAYATNEDNVLNVALPGVLANDTDTESDPLTSAIVVASGPANGTLTLNADGSFTYTPDADFNGSDSFRYTANDGLLDSNEGTVTITVNAVNDAPVAVDEDNVLNVAAPGVLANDTDTESDPLTSAIVAASGPSNGTLTFNADGSFIYTPDADFNGSDSFRYTANDSLLDSNEGTVIITVNAVNDGPVMDPIADQLVDALTTLNVGVSASDIDSASLTLSAPGLPAFGALTDIGDGTGSILFTPGAADGGVYTITVEVSDGALTDSTSFDLTVDDQITATFNTAMQRPDEPLGGPSWVTTLNVNFYAPGADPNVTAPLFQLTPSTDQNGDFAVTLTLGTYDVRIKGPHTLRVLLSSVDLTSDATVVVGTLLEGDFNDDNIVDLQDYSAVLRDDVFLKLVTDPGFPAGFEETDFTDDGIIDISDYNLVIINILKFGAEPF